MLLEPVPTDEIGDLRLNQDSPDDDDEPFSDRDTCCGSSLVSPASPTTPLSPMSLVTSMSSLDAPDSPSSATSPSDDVDAVQPDAGTSALTAVASVTRSNALAPTVSSAPDFVTPRTMDVRLLRGPFSPIQFLRHTTTTFTRRLTTPAATPPERTRSKLFPLLFKPKSRASPAIVPLSVASVSTPVTMIPPRTTPLSLLDLPLELLRLILVHVHPHAVARILARLCRRTRALRDADVFADVSFARANLALFLTEQTASARRSGVPGKALMALQSEVALANAAAETGIGAGNGALTQTTAVAQGDQAEQAHVPHPRPRLIDIQVLRALNWLKLGTSYVQALILHRGFRRSTCAILNRDLRFTESLLKHHQSPIAKLINKALLAVIESRAAGLSPPSLSCSSATSSFSNTNSSIAASLDSPTVLLVHPTIANLTSGLSGGPGMFDVSSDQYFAVRWVAATDAADCLAAMLERYSVPPTPLSREFERAVNMGRERIVRLLVDSGRVDPTRRNNVALSQACLHGHVSIARYLLEQPGVDAAAEDNNPLRSAAANGRDEVVRLLLDRRGVDIAAKDHYAIRHAVKNGHREVVELLLERGGDPSLDGCESVTWAAAYGHVEVIRLLLDHPGVDLSAHNNRAIRFSAENGCCEMVRLLLKVPGVDPKANKSEALRWASRHGYVEIVRMLIEAGCDVRANRGEAVRRAVRRGHWRVVRLLVKGLMRSKRVDRAE
ncbi:hypothetical protein HK101_007427 [Irineochytrium annulatum]|nr:hypothetical protein HK101_007427 [Irineochytrium annulatum]